MKQGLAATLVAAAVATGVAVTTSAAPAGAATGTPLVGTFRLAPGAQASGASVTGSYFRMLQPGGTVAAGPYLANANSALRDQTYTPFTPGTDGGLVTGGYQPEPKPGFDANGNSLAKRIIAPTPFFGVNFSVDTNPVDLQTKTAVKAPAISVDAAGKLSGNLESFDASWNNQEFNQGSPKPNGTRPGVTADPTGTYNSATGAYTLNWASQIVGGPFNNFTGVWHFTGTFAPATSAPTVTGLSPTSGPAAGGNAVTISGAGLAGATAVKFGATAATITANTATAVTATAPTGTGIVDVTVTTAGGTSAVVAADRYTYTAAKPAKVNPLTALLAKLLPPPSETGGIGPIVPLLGAFGPFASEAVSFLPVINALTPALSPLLPTFGRGVQKLQPVLDVLVPVLSDLAQKGFDVIAPVYKPYRLQILLAANRLAKAFAPFVSKVVNLPTLPYLQSIEGIVARALGAKAAAGQLATR